MEILNHFKREDQNGIIIYRLKENEVNNFLSKLISDFRVCYITNEDLESKCKKNVLTSKQFLEKYIIPDKGNIKSGDFGEILSHFLVIESHRKKGIILTGPLKWQWKENKNKAMPYTDSLMFSIADSDNYSGNDLIVTIESKMKATNSSLHRIQEAIDGAALDKLSRMSKTLIWLEEKYARLGDKENRKKIERFKDPATHGSYQKTHKAITLLDCDFENGELNKTYSNPENLVVIVFSLKNLKKIYEKTFFDIINS